MTGLPISTLPQAASGFIRRNPYTASTLLLLPLLLVVLMLMMLRLVAACGSTEASQSPKVCSVRNILDDWH